MTRIGHGVEGGFTRGTRIPDHPAYRYGQFLRIG
jgi:hypothetical protein